MLLSTHLLCNSDTQQRWNPHVEHTWVPALLCVAVAPQPLPLPAHVALPLMKQPLKKDFKLSCKWNHAHQLAHPRETTE